MEPVGVRLSFFFLEFRTKSECGNGQNYPDESIDGLHLLTQNSGDDDDEQCAEDRSCNDHEACFRRRVIGVAVFAIRIRALAVRVVFCVGWPMGDLEVAGLADDRVPSVGAFAPVRRVSVQAEMGAAAVVLCARRPLVRLAALRNRSNL